MKNNHDLDRLTAAIMCETVSDIAAHKPAPLTFGQLLDAYAIATNDSHANPDNINAHACAAGLMYRIATIAAVSVCNKVADPRRKDTKSPKVSDSGQNPAILQIKRDINKDLTTISYQLRGQLYASDIRFRIDGDVYSTIVDPDSAAANDVATALTIGDGLDLVHTAVIALIDETDKCIDRDGYVDLTTPYNFRRLHKQVLIKTDSAPEAQWETISRAPIQVVFAAVRRAVSDSRAVRADPSNPYTYIDDYATDDDTGAVDRVYYRCGAYADIGGHAHGVYTADVVAYRDIDNIISQLNLTARQAKILDLRLSGHGYKSIAAYLGITQRGAAKQCQLVAAKATKIGFTPENIAAHAAELSDLYDIDGLGPVAVALADKANRIRDTYDPDRATAQLSHAAALACADRIASAIRGASGLDSDTAAKVTAAERANAAAIASVRAAKYAADAAAEKAAAEKAAAEKAAAEKAAAALARIERGYIDDVTAAMDRVQKAKSNNHNKRIK